MKEILDFLSELAVNNNRPWFQQNKERYDLIRDKVNVLTQRLIDRLATIDSNASALTPANCTYRIYRDTRFSADKSPYKTHIGIFMNPPLGKKSLTMGHYLHLEPGNVFFAAGTVCLPSPIIKALRQAIYDNVEEYLSIVKDPEFIKLLPNVGDNLLKTSPKGFPKDWPYMELIRPRDYVAYSEKLPEDTPLEQLPDLLTPYFRQAARFNAFHNYTIEDFIP